MCSGPRAGRAEGVTPLGSRGLRDPQQGGDDPGQGLELNSTEPRSLVCELGVVCRSGWVALAGSAPASGSVSCLAADPDPGGW